MSRTHRHGLASVVAAATMLIALAMAAPGIAVVRPLPGTLSNLTVTADHITGTLTLRPDGAAVTVDPGLRATLDGRDVSISHESAAQVPRSTVLLIDTSGSMGATGMATVRGAVRTFLASAPTDVRVGVVAFGSRVVTRLAPTTDRGVVQRTVDGLQASGETALFAGMDAAVQILGATGDRSIVLLSDGANTVGDRDSALATSTRALSAARIRVEVVRFTTGENDPAALAAFAAAGGGSVAQAGDARAVTTAFSGAARALNSQTAFDVTRPVGLTGEVPLLVTGTASGRPFSIQATVRLPAAPAPSSTTTPTSSVTSAAGAPLLRQPRSTWSPMLGLGLLAVVFGLFVLLVVLIDPLVRTERRGRAALLEHYSLRRSPGDESAAPDGQSAVAKSAVQLGERLMAQRPSTGRTMGLIQRADWAVRPGEWLVLRAVSVLVGAVLATILLPIPWWLSLPFGLVIGLLGPALALRTAAKRRAKKFEDMLPDALMLVSTTLASGFSLQHSVDAVARDAADPLGKEFARAVAETRIGADLSDALEHVATRMGSESMRWTTLAIRIQREVGGNLAETLRTTAGTLRERASLKRQVQALSAEGRLSAWILMALPVGILGFMAWRNPAYTSVLWTTLPGALMLGASAVGLVVGGIWLSRVVKIEV